MPNLDVPPVPPSMLKAGFTRRPMAFVSPRAAAIAAIRRTSPIESAIRCQCTIAFAGCGEVDILLRDPAFRGQADLPRAGRIRADAQRRKVPYYRREGVDLHGEQNIKAGEGPVESLCLCGKDLAGVNVAGRVLTRQGEGIFAHGAPSFRVLLMTV